MANGTDGSSTFHRSLRRNCSSLSLLGFFDEIVDPLTFKFHCIDTFWLSRFGRPPVFSRVLDNIALDTTFALHETSSVNRVCVPSTPPGPPPQLLLASWRARLPARTVNTPPSLCKRSHLRYLPPKPRSPPPLEVSVSGARQDARAWKTEVRPTLGASGWDL